MIDFTGSVWGILSMFNSEIVSSYSYGVLWRPKGRCWNESYTPVIASMLPLQVLSQTECVCNTVWVRRMLYKGHFQPVTSWNFYTSSHRTLAAFSFAVETRSDASVMYLHYCAALAFFTSGNYIWKIFLSAIFQNPMEKSQCFLRRSLWDANFRVNLHK